MSYVHGYTERETIRLYEQSEILEELLHSGTCYPAGVKVLEVGCGVGAQTRILARRNPGAEIISIDISPASVKQTKQMLNEEGFENVEVHHMDITDHSFEAKSFDHIFVCFVLEHLDYPERVLGQFHNLMKPGGTLTLIEGDHGSCFWYPETPESIEAWNGLISAQQALGHDPLIGRRLYPLLSGSDFRITSVEPRWIYGDKLRPALLDGVLNKIITPMVFSAQDIVLEEKFADENVWQTGLNYFGTLSTKPEATFFYSWFKAVGIKEERF